jgi:hypothetical protein
MVNYVYLILNKISDSSFLRLGTVLIGLGQNVNSGLISHPDEVFANQ